MTNIIGNAGGAPFVKISDLAKDDTLLLSHCTQRRSKLVTDNKDKHVLQEKAYEYYHASRRYFKSKLLKKGSTSLVTSRPYQQVEDLKSLMLSNRPKIFAEFTQQNQEEAEIALEFINSLMWGKDELNYEERMDSSEGFRLIMGTSIERVDWEREMGERLVPFSLGPIPTPFKTKQEFFTKNTPRVAVVNPLRFFPGNPFIESIEDQKEIMELMPMNLSDIRLKGQTKGIDGKPIYSNTGELTAQMIDQLTSDTDAELQDWMDTSGVGSQEDNQIESHDPRIRVEQWTFGADPGDKDRSPWIVTIIPDKVVLEKRRRKEGIQYVVKRFRLDSDLFWGIGLIEPNIPSYDEKNEYRNLRLNVRKRNYGMVLGVNQKMLVDETDLEPKAAMVLRFKGDPSRGLQSIPIHDNSAAMIQEEAVIDQDIERTGVPSSLVGQEEPTETATGISLLQNAAAAAFEKPRGRMEAGVERVVEKIGKLLNTHLIEERGFYVNVNGVMTQKFVNFSFFESESGEALFRLKVELGSTKPINEVAEQRAATQSFQLMANDPWWKQREIRLELGPKMGIKNAAKLLNDQPMITQAQAQQMAQEAFKKGEESKVKEEVAAFKLDEARKDLGDAEGVIQDKAERLKQKIIKATGSDGKQRASIS